MKLSARLFLLLAGLFILTHCANRQSFPIKTKSVPRKASSSALQQFQRAEKLKDTQRKTAMQMFTKIVREQEGSEVADDAAISLAKLYYDAHDYPAALLYFNKVIEASVTSPREMEARFRGSETLLQLNRAEDALKMLSPLEHQSFSKPELKSKIYDVKIQALTLLNRPLDLVYTLHQASTDLGPLGERYLQRAFELVENRLTDEELQRVAHDDSLGNLRVPALFRLALMLQQQKKYSAAAAHFEEVDRLTPETEMGERARQALQQIKARNQVSPRTIGVVVPMTGKLAHIGERTLNGIQLALGTFATARPDFVLSVVDSEGVPEAARRGVERLVFEDHVIAILGSVESKTAVAVASKANELGVPSIGLSQKSGLTDIGLSVFRNAMTSEMQVRSLVDTAMNKMGLKSFAVLFPNDPYGIEYTNLFWDEVSARGGKIRAAQPYDSKETDFRDPVKKLVGMYYVEDRADEQRLLMKQWLIKNPHRSARQAAPTDLLPPVIDFEALFIPDVPKSVGQIAPMLAYYDVSHIRLLGTNVWNQPDIIKRADKYVENAVFVDSVLNEDPRFRESAFFKNFSAAFGYEPGLFEAQAYESALIIKQAILKGSETREDLQQILSTTRTFDGVNGPVTLNSRREFIRPLVALTVKDKKIIPLQ